MATFDTVRAGMVATLALCPSLKEILPYQPSALNLDMTAWVGNITDDPTFGQATVHLYTVPVTVCVMLNAQFEAGIAATEPVIDEVLGVIATHQKLGVVSIFHVIPRQIFEAAFGEPAEFIGFRAMFEVKQRIAYAIQNGM